MSMGWAGSKSLANGKRMPIIAALKVCVVSRECSGQGFCVRIWIRQLMDFLTTGLWRIRLEDVAGRKSVLMRCLRVFVLAVRDFGADRCALRASALTFYVALAAVPVLALVFAVARGFGLEKVLRAWILGQLQGAEETAQRIIGFSHDLLATSQGGVVAGVGVLILFYTVIGLLSNIERSFNDIWGIRRGRSVVRRFADYLSLAVVCPILLVFANGLTVMVTTPLRGVVAGSELLGPAVLLVLWFLPYVIAWTLFGFVYFFVPNTKVRLGSAVFAGVVAGTAYEVFLSLYVWSQLGVARYSAVYGSFAAVPMFLVWLQVSWFIVLFGAELSFAHQNIQRYEFEPDCDRVSMSFKKLVALWMTQLLVRDFAAGLPARTAGKVAEELKLPLRLASNVLGELVEAGILSETAGGRSDEAGYQPGRDPQLLTTAFVCEALERRGTDGIPLARTKDVERLSECLKEMAEAGAKSKANVPLKEL